MGTAWAGPIFRPLIIGLIVGVISIVMIIKGIQTLKKLSLVPKKTVETLKEDKTWAQNSKLLSKRSNRQQRKDSHGPLLLGKCYPA
jgi:hypothetical protein